MGGGSSAAVEVAEVGMTPRGGRHRRPQNYLAQIDALVIVKPMIDVPGFDNILAP